MRFNKKIMFTAASACALAFGLAQTAAAHVVVKPGDVKTGAYQTFVVSVPVEKNSSTVGVKLEIPEGLTSVTPNVKPGWVVKTEKQGEGTAATVKSIAWTGGEVGVGFRDEFSFSAKTPDQPTDIQWKAYQTYADGTTASWDQQPGGEEKEGGTSGPFSVTKVAGESDLDKALKNTDGKVQSAQYSADRALYIAIGGVALAGVAVIVALVMRRPRV